MRKGLLVCAFVLAVMNIFLSQSAFADSSKDYDVIADKVIVGIISEKDFEEMNLSVEEKVEVFFNIALRRGWSLTKDDLFDIFLTEKNPSPESKQEIEVGGVYLLECSQFVEFYDSGVTNIVYPLYYMTAAPGECGPDTDDIVLVYNNVYGGNPDYYRWNSNLWWVRTVLTVAYNNGLSANGLCNSTIHVCIGTKGQVLGDDMLYVYLWRY